MSIKARGLEAILRKWDIAKGKLPRRIDKAAHKSASLIMRNIQMNLSGSRAGMPGKVTGQYQNNWRVVKLDNDPNPIYGVITTAPQSDRLEYGFVGADSLGRMYHQAPMPHRRPAVEAARKEMGKHYVEALVEVYS